MVCYEAVCKLNCQQIIVIYINILPSKKKCVVISRVKNICFERKINLTILWPGSKRCARRSKITRERITTLCQSWASIVSCWPGIGTAMINCLFIKRGPLTHYWFVAGLTSQMASHHWFSIGLESPVYCSNRVTSRQTGLIDTLNATRF